MKTAQFKQTRKMRGSFYNSLMGNNSSVPVIGEGATICLHSDRHAYEVIEVSPDQKKAKIQRYQPRRVDDLGMTDSGQEYAYETLTDEVMDVVWYRGKWRKVYRTVEFTKEFTDNCGSTFPAMSLSETQKELIYTANDGCREHMPQQVVEGITRLKKNYSPVSILWGQKAEYYDFSF